MPYRLIQRWMEGQRALERVREAFFHFCVVDVYKVNDQPAGNGEKYGTVATKKVAEKVKTGRFAIEEQRGVWRYICGIRHDWCGSHDVLDG
jgi:hypothetical protein